MKPDRAASPPRADAPGAPVAGSAQSGASVLGRAWAAARGLGAALALVVLGLGAAGLLSLAAVRVGFDLWAGIDPLLPPGRRPYLGPAELARRAFAADALRQVFLAALVIGAARWRDPAGWRGRLALGRGHPDRLRPAALLAILAVWPALHLAWVGAVAAWFGAGLGWRAQFLPDPGPAATAARLAYLAVLAPFAEELLLRGAAYARARDAVGPAGAVLATALVFCAAHLSAVHVPDTHVPAWGPAGPVALLPLALALGWLRWRTGRLWPCVALHGWSNLTTVALVPWPT